MHKTLLAVAALGAISTPAFAGTETTDMDVEVVIQDFCSISANKMNFGTQNGVGTADIDATTTLSMTCTPDASYDISMDDGDNASGTQRQLSDGTNSIAYALYLDSYSTEWNGTNTVAGTATGAVQTFTVYGRIPQSVTPVPAGTYSDVVTVSVAF